MAKPAKEKFNLDIDKRGIENQGYDKYDKNSPPKYLWDRKIFSLIWLSYCVSFPKLYTGKETYLENLGTRAIKDTFADRDIQRLIGKWELVWGVSVEQRQTSNIADGTMFVAKYHPYSTNKNEDSYEFNKEYKEYNEDCDTERYVISIAGTNPFSIFATIFQDLSIFKTRSWNHGEPWSKDVRDKTSKSDKPAIASGASRGLKVHLTKMQGSRGELILEFLRNQINSLLENKKKEKIEKIKTGIDDIEEKLESIIRESDLNITQTSGRKTLRTEEKKDIIEKKKDIIEEKQDIIEELKEQEEIIKKIVKKVIKATKRSLQNRDIEEILNLDDRDLKKLITRQADEYDDIVSDEAIEKIITEIKAKIESLRTTITRKLKVEITVAGHSLGGALAQIVAFALKERQKKWDKYGLCKIKVVSVGNPCFTNDKFVAKYNDKGLGKNTYRFWCDLDMVPSLTNNTGKLATIYEPDISGSILISTCTDILRQSTKQNKYKHISNQPAAFNGYKGKFNRKFALQYINDNREIKDYISTQTTSLIFLLLFQQLQVALFVPNFIGDVVEDTFKGITKEYSEAFAKILAQALDSGGQANVALGNFFERFFDAFSGIPGFGTFAQFNANLIDSNNIVNLMNWSVQFAYQHVAQYEEYLKIKDFTKKMREITKESEKDMKYSSKARLE